MEAIYWLCFVNFSHVLAAYANFLWETEEEDEDEAEADVAEELRVMNTNLREGTVASATA